MIIIEDPFALKDWYTLDIFTGLLRFRLFSLSQPSLHLVFLQSIRLITDTWSLLNSSSYCASRDFQLALLVSKWDNSKPVRNWPTISHVGWTNMSEKPTWDFDVFVVYLSHRYEIGSPCSLSKSPCNFVNYDLLELSIYLSPKFCETPFRPLFANEPGLSRVADICRMHHHFHAEQFIFLLFVKILQKLL